MADPFDTPGYRFALNRYAGDGVTTQWDISFAGVSPGYISQDHVRAVSINDSTGVETPIILTPSNFLLPTRLQITPAIPVGYTLEIRRNSPKNEPLLDYVDGALMIEKNLDTSNQQTVYAVAEMVDRFADSLDVIEDFTVEVMDRLVDVENTANTALTTADATTEVANTALAQAGAAVVTANEAMVAVAGAEEAALLATAAAGTATTAANNANAAATAATSTAAAAVSTAEAAVDIAEAAETTANGIAGTANTALTNSNAAVTTANDAAALAGTFDGRIDDLELRVIPGLLPGAGAHDLNTYITSGDWVQNSNSAAALGTNYPLPNAGYLEVRYGATNVLFQRYTTYPVAGVVRSFVRCRNASNFWTAWKENADTVAVAAAQSDAATALTTANSFNGRITALEASPLMHGQVELVYSGTTQLILRPVDGGGMFIGGVMRQVTGNINISNSGLAANTHYYIYLAWVSGAWQVTVEAAATNPHARGALGIEIKNGDASKLLVGQCYTTATAGFAMTGISRLVSSWYNCREVSVAEAPTNSDTTSTSYVKLTSGVNQLLWANQVVRLSATGFFAQLASGSLGAYCGIAVDGTLIIGGDGWTGNGTTGFQIPTAMVGSYVSSTDALRNFATYGNTSTGVAVRFRHLLTAACGPR